MSEARERSLKPGETRDYSIRVSQAIGKPMTASVSLTIWDDKHRIACTEKIVTGSWEGELTTHDCLSAALRTTINLLLDRMSRSELGGTPQG